jgi:hypothetical protein
MPEDRMKNTTARNWIAAYAVVGVLTFVFQTWVRLDQCVGAADCAISLVKGAVWSTIWPASWVVYAAGFFPQ